MEKLIGMLSPDKAKIAAISPVNFAANFKAPVLLIPFDDDLVALFACSAKMEAALKKAGKPARLVKLKNDDRCFRTANPGSGSCGNSIGSSRERSAPTHCREKSLAGGKRLVVPPIRGR